MSAAFIGCKISLISKSEIRYEGILYTIDTKESTIALAKVRSFGTEDRQTDKPVAPRNEVYEYIIFRASDIKDLIVDDPPATSPGLSDPAIIQAQSVGSSSLPVSNYSAAATSTSSVSTAQGPKSQLSNVLASAVNSQASAAAAAAAAASRGSTPTNVKSSSPVQEREPRRQANVGQNRENRQVQRNDNRGRQNNSNNNQGQQRGQPRQNQMGRGGFYQTQGYGGRGRQQQGRAPFQQRQPGHQYGFNQRRGQSFPRPPRTDVTKLDDYDFEKANQEFTELEKGISNLDVNDKNEVENTENENENDEVAYDKQKSFFDAISCEALERSKGNVQRVDRRQERKLNEETFGVGGVRSYRPRGFGRGGYNNRGYGNRNYSNRGNWNGNRRGGDQRRANGPTEPRKPAAVET